MDRGAGVNIARPLAKSATLRCQQGRVPDIVKLLLDSRADPNQSAKSRTPLHVVAEDGYLQCVIHLVDAGAVLNALTSNGIRPIHLAKLQGHDVVAYLHSHGAARPTVATISVRVVSASTESGQVIFGRTCGACHLVVPGVQNPSPICGTS